MERRNKWMDLKDTLCQNLTSILTMHYQTDTASCIFPKPSYL